MKVTFEGSPAEIAELISTLKRDAGYYWTYTSPHIDVTTGDKTNSKPWWDTITTTSKGSDNYNITFADEGPSTLTTTNTITINASDCATLSNR